MYWEGRHKRGRNYYYSPQTNDVTSFIFYTNEILDYKNKNVTKIKEEWITLSPKNYLAHVCTTNNFGDLLISIKSSTKAKQENIV